MIAGLEEGQASRIAVEPAGAYHHAFERRLGEAGLPLVKVNPDPARRFAEAIGKLAKTGAVDAAMLARSRALMELQARPIVSETLDPMKELLAARRGLVKDRAAAKNRDQPHRSPLAETHRRPTASPDRAPACRYRRGYGGAVDRRPRPKNALRHPCEHSRNWRNHRLELAHRDARTRHDRE